MDDYKKKKNKLIVKVICSVLALVFVLTVSTYSWFLKGESARVNSIELNASGAISMSGSADDTNFTNQINIDFGKNKVLKEYASDGNNFYEPDYGSDGTPFRYRKVDSALAKDGIIEFNLTLKSKDAFALYLSAGSKVEPIDANTKADYVCGGVRVAFLTTTYTNIWIPNPTYQYDHSRHEIIQNGKVEDEYIFPHSPDSNKQVLDANEIIKVPTSNAPFGVDSSKRIYWGDPAQLAKTDMAPILVTADTEQEVTVSFTVRIWIEGNDRETHSDLIDGKFKFRLCFEAREIKK